MFSLPFRSFHHGPSNKTCFVARQHGPVVVLVRHGEGGDKSNPDMRIILLLKCEHHVEQSLLWRCYYWWRLGQYAMSNGKNSIQLRYKLTPDPQHGSSVVMIDCNGHVRPALPPLPTKPTKQSAFRRMRRYQALSLPKNSVIQTFQQQRCTAQPY